MTSKQIARDAADILTKKNKEYLGTWATILPMRVAQDIIQSAIDAATAQDKQRIEECNEQINSLLEQIGLPKESFLNYREEVEYLKGQIKDHLQIIGDDNEKLEDLERQIKKLLAVIEPFAKVGDPECWDFRNSCFHQDSNKVLFGIGSREQTTKQAKVTFGDFRRAWECYQAAAKIYKEVTGGE